MTAYLHIRLQMSWIDKMREYAIGKHLDDKMKNNNAK